MRQLIRCAWLVLALLVIAACGQSAPTPAAAAAVAGAAKPEVTVYRSPT